MIRRLVDISEKEGKITRSPYDSTMYEVSSGVYPLGSRARRLMIELTQMRREIDTLSPISDENILEWKATLQGPPGTPYEDGIFYVYLNLTDSDYPWEPPRVWFHTKIYHPNIACDTGAIYADYLAGYRERRSQPPTAVDAPVTERVEQANSSDLERTQRDLVLSAPRWSPSFTLESIVVGLFVVLNEPCLTDPLEQEIAEQMENDPEGFERTAREWTRRHATGKV